jgi:chorismate dehydratase
LKKIKVGIVNYLNTKPLLYGIQHSTLQEELELIEDYPANIARLLVDGDIDLGLVPVSVIPRLEEYHIITDYCIGCDGPVASVCLFSEVPIEQIKEVLLDYQSRTSVALAKILLKDYWKIQPKLTDARPDFLSSVKGTTAAVIIGDRALEQRKHSPYIYDLGEAWQQHTGLPFVFAAWISNKQLPQDLIERFNEANKKGLENIDTVVAENPYPIYSLQQYYTKHINYFLDDEKRKGLEKFIRMLTPVTV